MSLPGYWMNETSGVLRPIVMKYLAGEQLEPLEVGATRSGRHRDARRDCRLPRRDPSRRLDAALHPRVPGRVALTDSNPSYRSKT